MSISGSVKLHRFMLTFITAFKDETGKTGMKHVNTTISRQIKSIPLGYIKQAQDSVAMQLTYFGVAPENIIDVTFLSASYLGLMNEKEFTEGLSEEHKRAAELYSSGSDKDSKSKPNPFDA